MSLPPKRELLTIDSDEFCELERASQEKMSQSETFFMLKQRLEDNGVSQHPELTTCAKLISSLLTPLDTQTGERDPRMERAIFIASQCGFTVVRALLKTSALNIPPDVIHKSQVNYLQSMHQSFLETYAADTTQPPEWKDAEAENYFTNQGFIALGGISGMFYAVERVEDLLSRTPLIREKGKAAAGLACGIYLNAIEVSSERDLLRMRLELAEADKARQGDETNDLLNWEELLVNN